MKSLKLLLIGFSSAGVLFLGACGNSNQATTNPDSLAPSETPAETEQSDQAGTPQAGGQVVESGPYHLEFVPVKEAGGTHIDFYLQTGDNHEAISGAQVMAQVQLPDGSQKSLPLTYDAEGKHYTALLSEKTPGEYQVTILSNIKGEKVNGRFTFSR